VLDEPFEGAQVTQTQVPAAAARLRHGVNLSHWFSQVYVAPGYSAAHYDSYMKQSDLELIAAQGFDHVRFPIGVEHLLEADGSGLDAEFVARIEREIAQLHALGLAVIVDAHPEAEFKNDLARSDDAVERFVSMWSALAARFADSDPASTAFEVLNEPDIGDNARWVEILNRGLGAIRAAAPEHSVVASGDLFSQLPTLLELPTLDDGNLIYNIHVYDPMALTHQGARWAPDWAQHTRGLDYPMDLENVSALQAATDDPDAHAALDEYATEGWDRARYESFLAPAVAWAAARGVPLTCNEFGVYKTFAPRAARLRWLADVTSVFVEQGIGWTVWDYAGDFGVATGDGGHRQPDVEVLAALGLEARR
jgi:endoglucanase